MRGWLILRTIKKLEAFRGFEDDLYTNMDVDCRHWTIKRMLAAVGVIGRCMDGILSIEPWNRSLTVTD